MSVIPVEVVGESEVLGTSVDQEGAEITSSLNLSL